MYTLRTMDVRDKYMIMIINVTMKSNDMKEFSCVIVGGEIPRFKMLQNREYWSKLSTTLY